MTNSNKPSEKSITKGIKNALLGGAAGFFSGLMEDVLQPNNPLNVPSLADYMTDSMTTNSSARSRGERREKLAAHILSGLVSNMTAQLEQPDRLTSLAVDLANKLMEKLDAQSSDELRSELEVRAKENEENKKKQAAPVGITQFLTPLEKQHIQQQIQQQHNVPYTKIKPIQSNLNPQDQIFMSDFENNSSDDAGATADL